MDWLPVGVVITDENQELAHINQEMKYYFNEIPIKLQESFAAADINTISVFNPTIDDSRSIMEKLRDRNDNTKTLKDLMETRNDVKIGEQVYSMTCENTGKVFEVKTKYLPEIWPKGYKIAVIKDQSVYEQLVREQMIKRYQKMLISSITHDIRNPLNAIAGYSTVLNGTNDMSKISELVSKIEYSIQQADYILSGACDLIIGESSAVILQPQTFYVKPAIDQVISIISPSLENKPVALHIVLDQKVPATICSDIKKYKMILFNILVNATKYTSSGSIKISLNFDENTDILTTIIEDTGSGIDNDKLSLLFELYGNIEKANVYDPLGMSLGLCLCKKLSKELGGDISAISAIGIGSTFSFTIKNKLSIASSAVNIEEENTGPIEEIKDEKIHGIRRFFPHKLSKIVNSNILAISNLQSKISSNEPQRMLSANNTEKIQMTEDLNKNWKSILHAPKDEISQHHKRPHRGYLFIQKIEDLPIKLDTSIEKCECPEILIVDDEPSNRAVLKAYMTSIKYKVQEAENGKIAVGLVTSRLQNKCCKRYKLITMDINMPQMDGTEATQRIVKIFKDHPEAITSIIAVTAANFQTKQDFDNLLSVGFNDICILVI